jgi:hypothetical protein
VVGVRGGTVSQIHKTLSLQSFQITVLHRVKLVNSFLIPDVGILNIGNLLSVAK